MMLTGTLSFTLIGALLFLSIYMIWKNPRSPTHQTFSLFTMLVVGVLTCMYIMQAGAVSEAVALTALRFYYLFGIFLAPSFLFFAYNLVKKPVPGVVKKSIPVLMLALVLLMLAGVFFTGVQRMQDGGFVPLQTRWDDLVDILNIAIAAAGVVVLLQAYRLDRSEIFRKQVHLVTAGIFILVGTSLLFMIFLPHADKGAYEMLYFFGLTASITAMTGTWAVAILRYRMLIVEPRQEELRRAQQKYLSMPGRCYYVEEAEGDPAGKSHEVFADLAAHGAYGMALTSADTREVKGLYKLKKTPVIDVRAVDIASSYNTIHKFVSTNRDSVVLLDGLGDLYSRGSKWDLVTYMKVSKFVERLSRQARRHRAMVIIPLDRTRFAPGDYALLKSSLFDFSSETQVRIKEMETANERLTQSLVALEKSYRTLERTNRELVKQKRHAEFMSDLITHEGGNHNQGVLTNLEMLKMVDDLTPTQGKYVDRAIEAVMMSKELIENVRKGDTETLKRGRLWLKDRRPEHSQKGRKIGGGAQRRVRRGSNRRKF